MPRGIYTRTRWSPEKPIIYTGYIECLSCGQGSQRQLQNIKRWSGYCRPCISKQRQEIPLPPQWRENVSRGRKGKLTGEQHWNWQGGLTEVNEAERGRFKRTMVNKILQRDNFTCQVCQQYGGSLHVDHIKRWSDYPELRFDSDNCRTLCMACHYYVTFKRKLPQGVVWGLHPNKRVTSLD